MKSKAYVIAIAEGSDFYIPDALHIERNDALMLVPDDEAAARLAEKDGIELIYNMHHVPNGVYVDTPENRRVIESNLRKFSEYEKWGYDYGTKNM